MKWIVIAALLIFAGGVVYVTIAPVQAQCEVCLEFDGRMVCRSGAGATEAEARQAAQESACGGNVSGMSELIICRGREPEAVHCTTR